MQELNIKYYKYRPDSGYEYYHTTNDKLKLVNSRNIKSYIYNIETHFNLKYAESDKIVFIFFSHSFLDVVRSITKDAFTDTIISNIKTGITKKVILFCEDMDWYSDNDAVPEIIKTFNELFGNDIDKLYITLTNRNWKFNWGNLNVQYNLGCFPFVFELNYEQSYRYDLTKLDRPNHFFSNQNEPRGARMYFYKFLIDNNLLDKFEYSFFFKHSDKQFLNWSNIEGGRDTLDNIDNFEFPVKIFDNETQDDFYKKLKIINFEKSLNGYIDVNMETALFNRDFFGFSEKTFKSIITKKPFIIFGSHFTYKGLHEMGFKTFPTLFNESKLDNGFKEWEFKERLQFFLDEVKRIADMDINLIKQYYIDNLEVCEFNYAHLLRLIDKDYNTFKNLITI
jgi:hypothetical protein